MNNDINNEKIRQIDFIKMMIIIKQTQDFMFYCFREY